MEGEGKFENIFTKNANMSEILRKLCGKLSHECCEIGYRSLSLKGAARMSLN